MARTPFVTQPVSTLHHRSAHRGPATISGENCETPCGPAGSCSAAASATAVPGCSTGAAVGCVGLDERLFERPPPVRVHRPPGPSTGRSVLFRHAHCSGDGPATRPDPDVALTGASEAVFDWEGGTRIGESIHTFNRTLGGRPDTGAQRWSSVATGWSGEAHNRSQARWPGCGDDLGGSFWVISRAANPLVERYPNPFITAVRSHVNDFVSGHNPASLEELAELLRKSV
jgi:hypothetical protein